MERAGFEVVMVEPQDIVDVSKLEKLIELKGNPIGANNWLVRAALMVTLHLSRIMNRPDEFFLYAQKARSG